MSAPAAGSIGPYRIVRTLGSGGWSTVYEVVAPDGAHVALKRLAAGLAPTALARFRREVESLHRIAHPGVLRLLDAGVDGGAPYLVTPMVTGTSLRQLLGRGPLGVEGALAIVLAAADAVAAIHAAGLVHRDLKPENLMLTATGEVVVIDLGLALGPEHSRHTAEDTLTGSVPYMSPEQIDDRAPSPASDVWALGVVLYEAIAGRRPFERARQSEEVAAILAGRYPRLGERAPGCPDELERLVAACLAAAPAQRPADAAALAAMLVPLVDWTAPASLADERARLLADPIGHAWAIRAARVAVAVRDAERALAAGDRFAATRAVERGLAYAPDEPVLRALVERVMAAPPAIVAAPPPPRRRTVVWGGAIAVVTGALAIGAIAASSSPSSSPAAGSPPDAAPAAAEPPAVTRPAHVAPSRPAHVRPSRPAPGRPPVAP